MLDVRHLSISFRRYNHALRQGRLTTIFDLNLGVTAGELVAVVGASGAGKSLLAHAILGILPPNAKVQGEILFKGAPLTERRKRELRGNEITLVPQSVGFLNPLAKVGSQLVRAAKLAGLDKRRLNQAAAEALERYGLSPQVMSLYPYELSGGMARRVLTAMATVGDPALVVADEPTSGLDSKAAAESLKWLRHLADRGKGILLITHDIEAALQVVDTVVVLHAGTTVEIAAAEDFQSKSHQLRHPYTRALWQALPQNGLRVDLAPVNTLADEVKVKGCAYAAQCHLADPACLSESPGLKNCNGGRVRCLNAEGSI